jgi:putative spermidine/putrescine transport system substrate-binding protein
MTVDRREILKGALKLGGAVAAPSLLAAPAFAQSLRGTGEVVVYDGGGAWGEAKRISLFEPFEKETGIKVIAQPRTDLGAVRASVVAGSPRYDVTILTGGNTAAFEREGLLLPVDYGYFNKADLSGFSPVPTGKFTVPHIIYSLLIAYDPSKFNASAPATWADVWDAKKFPGGRSLCTGTRGPDGAVFEAALLADGVDPAKLYPLDWDRAFKSLSRLRPEIVKWWNSGAEGPQLIIDRQVAVGSAWNGRIFAANDQAKKIGFTWNQGILQYDSWVILKGSKNQENANKLLAFMSRAEVQANFCKHILYAPSNARAYDHIAPERARMLPTFPEFRKQQIVQNYDFWNALGKEGKPNNQVAVAQWERWLVGAR